MSLPIPPITSFKIMEEACPTTSIFSFQSFNSVFCVEEAFFFPCVPWDICLFNNSLRDTFSVIQVLSAWAQGALISVSPFLTHLCAGLHTVMSKETLQPFLSPLIFIWHCSGHGRCKYMR